MGHRHMILCLMAVLIASACSSDDAVNSSPTNNDRRQDAIALDVYASNYVSTRSTIMNNTADLAAAGGFGVFCFNTGSTEYTSGQSSFAPDYMYNQLVTSSDEGQTWTYSPAKYWPNDAEQHVSFFAYAPYSSTTLGSSLVPSEVNQKGDATITITSNSDATSTDILWADPATTMNMHHQNPVDNPTQQTTGSKVKFNFKHKMSLIGGSENAVGTGSGLMAVLDIDQSGKITGGGKPDDTRVTIKSIQIRQYGYRETADGETTKECCTSGTLNLATGTWTKTYGSTVDRGYYDIESDASVSGNTIKASLAEPVIVSSFNDLPEGVTSNATNVYGKEGSSLLIIPDETKIPVLEFKVTYIVRTKDANLAKGYSEVSQTLTRYVTLNAAAQAGKRYNITMHFGLNSLKFTGNAEVWDFNSEVHFDDKGKNPETKDQYILDVEEGEPTPEDQPYLSKRNRWD